MIEPSFQKYPTLTHTILPMVIKYRFSGQILKDVKHIYKDPLHDHGIYYYHNDEDFREKVETTDDLIISGSNF